MSSPSVLIFGINYAPEPTGIAPYTSGLAQGLDDRGFEVKVITTRPHYPQWRVPADWGQRDAADLDGGVGVKRLRHYVPTKPTGARRALSELSFGANALARRWQSPDLVILVSPALLSSYAVLMRAAVGPRRPATGLILQDLYSTGASQAGDYGPVVTGTLSRIERRAIHQVDGVVAVHPRFKMRIVSDLGALDEKVRVIRNWTHVSPTVVDNRVSTRRSRGWNSSETIVLHTGAMGEKQDLANVVEAARLADREQASVRFVLVGDGGQRKMLESLAYGIKRLSFVPPVEAKDYLDLLYAADILLVNERPGVSDMAIPSKLTSYFSTGLPVLACTENHSTTADELIASGAGLIAAPGSPEALLEAVANLSADPDYRARVGGNGPLYSSTVLGRDVALDSYATWAHELLHARTG